MAALQQIEITQEQFANAYAKSGLAGCGISLDDAQKSPHLTKCINNIARISALAALRAQKQHHAQWWQQGNMA